MVRCLPVGDKRDDLQLSPGELSEGAIDFGRAAARLRQCAAAMVPRRKARVFAGRLWMA